MIAYIVNLLKVKTLSLCIMETVSPGHSGTAEYRKALPKTVVFDT